MKILVFGNLYKNALPIVFRDWLKNFSEIRVWIFFAARRRYCRLKVLFIVAVLEQSLTYKIVILSPLLLVLDVTQLNYCCCLILLFKIWILLKAPTL